MSVADTMRHKLTERFKPVRLDIIDDSQRHAGHAGAQPGGETHFDVTIVSDAFSGLGRVARQRCLEGQRDPIQAVRRASCLHSGRNRPDRHLDARYRQAAQGDCSHAVGQRVRVPFDAQRNVDALGKQYAGGPGFVDARAGQYVG